MFITISFSAPKLHDLLVFCVEDDHPVLVVERKGQIVRAFVGFATEFYFSEELVASDIAFYAARGYKGVVLPRAVLKAFRAWAVERGTSCICILQSTGVHPERFMGAFRDIGFTVSGCNMFQDL